MKAQYRWLPELPVEVRSTFACLPNPNDGRSPSTATTLRGSQSQGCIRREGTSEAAPEAVRQAVGGGYQSGWGRLLSVTNAIDAGTWRQGDSGWAQAGRPGAGGGGGDTSPLFQCVPHAHPHIAAHPPPTGLLGLLLFRALALC